MAKKNKKRIRAEGVALCVLKVKLPEPEKSLYEGHAQERKYPSLAAWVRRAMKLQHAREAQCRFDVPPPVIPARELKVFKRAIVKTEG
jgi:hypothetical protein